MDGAAFVEDYGRAILAGRASVLVGAGLSNGFGYPSWHRLVVPVARKLGVPVPEPVDYPLLAQYIENLDCGREILGAHVARRIGRVRTESGPNHVLLAQLAITDRWTTNYDCLIEDADETLAVVEQDDDLVVLQQGRRLLKMHGSVRFGSEEPVGGRDELVLSRFDYENYEFSHPRLWRLLQAQFLTSSFLFLGFSMTDPNFEAVFRIARLATPGRLMRHYAVMRSPESEPEYEHRKRELARSGIELVEVEDYDDITVLLRQLVARTKPSGVFVSGSARAPSDEPAGGSGAYPTAPGEQDLTAFAARLGERLTSLDVDRVVAAGELGAATGYAFLAGLAEYRSDRFLFLRRRSDAGLQAGSLRQGQIHFVGEEDGEASFVRAAALAHARAVVVLGGGPGSVDEAAQATAEGMAVIPVAHTGRAARKIWETLMRDLGSVRVGGQPVAEEVFVRLGSDDATVALDATLELIAAGLYLAS